MNVLIACEQSGVIRDMFNKAGHSAMSCDILPCESKARGLHYTGDIWECLKRFDRWDLIIAHPPCDFLCNSGVQWLYRKGKKVNGIDPVRWGNMQKGAAFFKRFLSLDPIKCPRVCVENPVMHGYAKAIVGMEQSCTYQPWQHGHGECKRTCLWLKGLPDLQPSRIVQGRKQTCANMSPGPNRSKLRAITLLGPARAMVKQWGTLA
jgi:hypothetical protein